MKTIELNCNAWHYKIASFTPGFRFFKYNANICNYPWRILFGMICMAIVAIFTFAITCVFGDTFAWAAASISNWIWINPEGYLAMIGFMVVFMITNIIAMIGALFGIQFLIEKCSKTDNFISQAYAAHKEKFCAKIEFVDK